MSYKYFVSYWHPEGAGRCDITRKEKITKIDDIFAIEKVISEGNGKEVLIINYVLMGKVYER